MSGSSSGEPTVGRSSELRQQPPMKNYWNFEGAEKLRNVNKSTNSVENRKSSGAATHAYHGDETHGQHGHEHKSANALRPILSTGSNMSDLHGFNQIQTRSLMKHLSLKPGESGFIWWYSVSNSFPIIAASLGPISNLNSVAALADPWRINLTNGDRPGDLKWFLALNAISLFCGCAANLSLFLNFSGRVNYVYAQIISILGWYFAFTLLFVLLISSEFIYFRPHHYYIKSEGFYHAIFTAILYFISATMLLINWIGHRKGMYSASFNLTTAQRRIMLQNVLYIFWIGIGGLLFSLLIGIRYTDAVYYCTVTVTTIGLGDIIPKNDLTRALVLPFALVGVIYLGLIVTTTTSAVLNSNGEALVFDRSERSRNTVYEKMIERQENEDPLAPKEAFVLIHKIHRRAIRRRKFSNLYWSMLAFSAFWLLGAMIFYFSEDSWSYFDALYFCSLCLLTIGYGDFTPKSSSARSFFIIWAIGAVPMMTILISNLSDNLFVWILDVGDSVTAWLLAVYSIRQEYHSFWKLRFRRLAKFFGGRKTRQEIQEEDNQVAAEEQKEDEEEQQVISEEPKEVDTTIADRNMRNEEEAIHSDAPDGPSATQRSGGSELNAAADRLVALVSEIRVLLAIAVHDPKKKFTYEEWQRITSLVAEGDLANMTSEFWLSERSPLRFPGPEVRYFLNEVLEGLQVGIYDMVDLLQSRDLQSTSAADTDNSSSHDSASSSR